LSLVEGTYRIPKAWLTYRGQRIPLESAEIDVSVAGSGEVSVFASVHMKAKLPGLSPGASAIEMTFEWEGESLRIEEARVFDADVHSSGETTVQFTGRLGRVG
jgi:hypothetical protein